MESIFNQIIVSAKRHWEYISAVAVTVSAIVIFFKNYIHIINLRLQNIKIRKELSNEGNINKLVINSIHSNIKNYNIEITSIAGKTLTNFEISEDELCQLLDIEFKNHPLLMKLDFESMPIPLKRGFFIIATKLQNDISIEGVRKTFFENEIFESWEKLRSIYFRAYSLPFRKNHKILANRTEFLKTINLLKQLLKALNEYVKKSKFTDRRIYQKLHALKNQAHSDFTLAETEYLFSNGINLPERKLGEIAIKLDLVISSIHKIMTNYEIPS